MLTIIYLISSSLIKSRNPHNCDFFFTFQNELKEIRSFCIMYNVIDIHIMILDLTNTKRHCTTAQASEASYYSRESIFFWAFSALSHYTRKTNWSLQTADKAIGHKNPATLLFHNSLSLFSQSAISNGDGETLDVIWGNTSWRTAYFAISSGQRRKNTTWKTRALQFFAKMDTENICLSTIYVAFWQMFSVCSVSQQTL